MTIVDSFLKKSSVAKNEKNEGALWSIEKISNKIKIEKFEQSHSAKKLEGQIIYSEKN